MKKYVLFIVLFGVVCQSVNAQNPAMPIDTVKRVKINATDTTSRDTAGIKNNNRIVSAIPRCYWGSFGFGPSSLGAFSGSFNANAELANRVLVTAGVQGETKAFLSNSAEVDSYNILVGKIFKKKFSLLSVSVGLSLVDVVNTTGYDLFSSQPPVKTDQYTIGIPILIQGYLVAFQTVSLGFNGYINLNTINTTAGIMVSVAIGRMATHTKRI